MKKVFLMLAAVAAMTFTACGDKKKADENNAAAADSIVAEAQEGDIQDPEQLGADLTKAMEANDGEGLKGKIDAAKEWAQNLLKEGKGEQAKGILEKIQSFLSENADKVTSVIGDNQYVQGALDWVKSVDAGDLINKAGEALGVEGAAEQAGAAAAAAGEQIKETANQAKEAIQNNEAVQAAQEKVEEVKDDVVKKGNEAVEAAKEEVGKAVDDAVNKGLEKVGNILGR